MPGSGLASAPAVTPISLSRGGDNGLRQAQVAVNLSNGGDNIVPEPGDEFGELTSAPAATPASVHRGGDNGLRQAQAAVSLSNGGDNIVPEPGDQFVSTPCVEQVTKRALAYLAVGYPVHLSGPAGTGKTTLAFHIAAQIGRPVSLMHGDDEFGSSDLVGRDVGYRRSNLVDNYVRSVWKTEEEMKMLWADNRLTTACLGGYTLIYDEFSRSRPEANNALLSVLSERILNLPKRHSTRGEAYVDVNPEFRAILTSNPEEYAGIHKTQDALMDRLITIRLSHYDRETEVEITRAKSGLARTEAETIVDIVRELRDVGVNNHRPTIRACIAVARILAHSGAHARCEDEVFRWVCHDVLDADTTKVTHGGHSVMPVKVDEVMRKVCSRGTNRSSKRESTDNG